MNTCSIMCIITLRLCSHRTRLKGAMSRYFSIFLKFLLCRALKVLNSQNKCLGLLFKTILWRLFYFLSFVATDGKDGNGLKHEEIRPAFSSCDTISTKNTKTRIMCCSFLKHFIRYLPHSLLGTFCAYVKPLSNDLAKNWTKTTKLLWHCPFNVKSVNALFNTFSVDGREILSPKWYVIG